MKITLSNELFFNETLDEFDEEYEKEQCPYCGIMTNNPCDGPQNNCEQAINEVYGAWLNDLS